MEITHPPFAAEARARLDAFRAGGAPDRVLADVDADGLSSAALLSGAMGAPVRLVGRGMNAWTDPVAAEAAGEAVIVADLGMRGRALGRRLCVIDHHVPTGTPETVTGEGATVIHGEALDPVPSTSLLAWWALGCPEDRGWLAALGCMGDYGDKAGHLEVAPAKKLWGAGRLRDLVSLVNAPRRAAAGDAAPALALLTGAENPAHALSGEVPGLAECEAAREEVKAAAAEARRAPPRFGARYGSEVAIVRIDTPCQVHPLTAQSWVGRLRGAIVFCANFGYLDGRVSFSGRAPKSKDIVALLAQHRPEGADPALYGNGHRQAAGGTLDHAAWNALMDDLGFGPEMRA